MFKWFWTIFSFGAPVIIWRVNPFVASVTCSRHQIAFKWSVKFWLQFLVNDEMENISVEEISV